MKKVKKESAKPKRTKTGVVFKKTITRMPMTEETRLKGSLWVQSMEKALNQK